MTSKDDTLIDRKHLIIETAAELFIKKGFHQTSIRDIASTAGISLGNLYNHFASKEALIAAIALLEAENNQVLETVLQSIKQPLQSLQDFLALYIEQHAQESAAILSAEVLAEALRNPNIGQGFITNHNQLATRLEALLAAGQQQGVLNFTLPTLSLAHILLDVLDSGCVKSFFYQGTEKQHYLMVLQQSCLQLLQVKYI